MKALTGTAVALSRDCLHHHIEMMYWCSENVGLGTWWNSLPLTPAGQDWSIQYLFGQTTFWFKREADATAFALRWS